ncbi:DEAD/DEAH box helicase [Paenibacillus sp. y28]|uniref:DEAD/DEAH box helicase n=1 Tax=Paenibacillus sp. y28 TaxID=3129110 RepID=UPI00301840BE
MNELFEALSIPAPLAAKLKEKGIITPSPVQAQAIPVLLEGKDALVQSQTGTGKTLAYLLPLLQRINPSSGDVQAVVVAPTQELAMQIRLELDEYGPALGIRALPLIGGASLSRQVDKLKLRPQVVVGTPGRLVELLKLRKLKMQAVRTLVVDEVDQVFDLGAQNQIEQIIRSALRDRQLMFFSATLTDAIRTTASRWMKDPQEIIVHPEHKTAPTLEHVFIVCEERDKIETLRRLVRNLNPKKALVFTNQTEDVGELMAKLKYAGLSIEAIYGDAGKQERARVMSGFRRGSFQLLLATDVAARGIDIPELSYVFQIDPAIDSEHYVHRAGRTGRMGRSGVVISIITERERFIVEKFAKQLGTRFTEKALAYGKLVDVQEKRGRKPVGKPAKPAAQSVTEGRRSGSKPGAELSAEAKRYSPKPAPQSAAETKRTTAKPAGEAGASRGKEAQAGALPSVSNRAGKNALSAGGGQSRPGAGAELLAAEGKAAVSARDPRTAAKTAKAEAKPKQKTKAERERDRKNKGAPRWLKAKQSQASPEQQP